MDPWTVIFLVGGLVLLGSELIAPSLLAMFFGIAALLTAGARALGLESVPLSFLVWSLTSLALVIPFRPLVQRLVPGRSEVKRDGTDVEQDRDAMGEVVEVVEVVGPDHDDGRIRFQGTTWQARSTTGTFQPGEKVQLVYRQGSLWIVEPVTDPHALGTRDLFASEAAAEVEATLQRKR